MFNLGGFAFRLAFQILCVLANIGYIYLCGRDNYAKIALNITYIYIFGYAVSFGLHNYLPRNIDINGNTIYIDSWLAAQIKKQICRVFFVATLLCCLLYNINFDIFILPLCVAMFFLLLVLNQFALSIKLRIYSMFISPEFLIAVTYFSAFLFPEILYFSVFILLSFFVSVLFIIAVRKTYEIKLENNQIRLSVLNNFVHGLFNILSSRFIELGFAYIYASNLAEYYVASRQSSILIFVWSGYAYFMPIIVSDYSKYDAVIFRKKLINNIFLQLIFFSVVGLFVYMANEFLLRLYLPNLYANPDMLLLVLVTTVAYIPYMYISSLITYMHEAKNNLTVIMLHSFIYFLCLFCGFSWIFFIGLFLIGMLLIIIINILDLHTKMPLVKKNDN